MELSSIQEPLTKIGQVLGIPAVVMAAWLIFSVRSLFERVKKLEGENKELTTTLNKIQVDIAFIRGKLEDKL